MTDKKNERKIALSLVALTTMLYMALRSALALTGLWYIELLAIPAVLGLCASAPRLPISRELPRRPVRLFAPGWATHLLAAPAFVAVVMLLARASAALGEAAGIRETATLVGPLWQRVLVYALLPAVCEEALFRGLFPSFLSPIGRRGSLVCCSILFALMHASPLRWPYALAAGLLLGTVAEAAASPLPGMILHFFNNLLALCLIGRSDAAYVSVCAVLVALAVVIRRLLPLSKRRDRIDAIRRVWRDDGATGRMMLELVRFPCVIVVALFVWAGVLSFF